MALKKIFHLEYKNKVGRGKHRHYTTLTKLCEFNNEIGIGYHSLKAYDFSVPYQNHAVIINKTDLVDSTVKKAPKGH